MQWDENELLKIHDVSVSFTLADGALLRVLQGVNISIHQGRTVSIVGRSGCGKSTLLNVLAGLLQPSAGALATPGGRPLPTCGYVFQSPRLMPWLTVRQNLEFVLKAHAVDQREWDERIRRKLDLVGLSGYVEEYPLRLSGGMQQRVGLARALVIEPELLLMDEPFSHLDEITAQRLRTETARICHEEAVSVLLVTHDLFEAVFMSDDIYILGGTPASVVGEKHVSLARPRNYRDTALYEEEAAISAQYESLFMDDAGAP